MRRKKDGWVNATHILKVANFPKAKRTRILEKDVQTGIHEKVQGGYGKYQGTWVPLKRAVEIAQQFGVLSDLNPVFDYISNGAITPPPAPKHHHATTATGTRKPRTTKAKNSKLSQNDSKIEPQSTQAKSKTPTKRTKKQKTSTANAETSTMTTATTLPPPPATSAPKRTGNKTNKVKPSPLNIPNSDNQYLNQSPLSASIPSTSASRNSLTNTINNNNFEYELNNTKRILKAPYSRYTSITNDLRLLDDDLQDELNELNEEEQDQEDLELENGHGGSGNNANGQGRINRKRKHNLSSINIPNANLSINPNSFYGRMHEPSTVEFMSEHDLDKALAESETYGDLKNARNLNFNSLQQSPNQIQPLYHNTQQHQYYNQNYNQPFSQQQPQHLKTIRNQAANNASSMLDKSYVKALYNYFIEMDSNPNCEMPFFITQPFDDFNVDQPIDNQGNTALHWACSMGDVNMCQILISRGCDIHVLNNKGEEPIVRSVMYANCYTRRTFNKLLDLLSDCLLDIDMNSRTLLHHISMATADKNNLPSSRYYTEILLIKIAETVQSNDFFKEFIDKQDINGNTALHILSFNNAQKCIKILLGYNARVDIRNKLNEQVGDYLTDNFKSDLNHPGFVLSQNNNTITQNSNTNYESLNLRPFKPTSVGGGNLLNFAQSQNGTSNKRPSYLDPFQTQTMNYHNYNYNYNNNNNNGDNGASSYGLLNFGKSVFLNPNSANHSSLTSIKMTQTNGQIFEKLNDLSNAFDTEINQKNDDLKELTSIVDQMDNDIEKTSNDIQDLLKNIFGYEIKNSKNLEISEIIKKVKIQSVEISNEYKEKESHLRRLIDRSQAITLAKIVQQYENDSLSKIEGEEPHSFDSSLSTDTMKNMIELARLQIIRKECVEFLISTQSTTDENVGAINSYRRLVAKLSNMPISEVDSSLNSIEDCLRRDIDITNIDSQMLNNEKKDFVDTKQ